MITPETWDFPPPSSSLLSHSVAIEGVAALFHSHQLNSLVCVTLPDCVQGPENIKSLLTNDCEYYKIKQLPLKEFIQPVFLKAFVKKGKLLALSSNTKYDLEDCFALTEEGSLQLSVQSDTYQILGLEGTASSNKTCSTHVININLREESFVSSKKQYDRIASKLEEIKLSFDTILSWTPDDERVCPSSIAEYFSRAGLQVEQCAPQMRTVHKYNTRIPDLDSNKAVQVLEWIGALALDCDMDLIDVDSTSDMEVPATSIIWKGLFSSHQIQDLFKSLVAFLQEKPSIPWVSMNVQAFHNSLLCQREQHYTIIIDNQLQCTLHKTISS